MKPIIGSQGEYVTEPKRDAECWIIYNYPDWCPVVTRWKPITTSHYVLLNGQLYATREAAEMALIRAKCIRRLKEMAYKDWRPDYVGHGWQAIMGYAEDVSIYFDAWFETEDAMQDAVATTTREEWDAFAYVYKPEDNE